MSQELHKTVLLDAAVEALITAPSGIYIDGTFGRGGHSRQILSLLSDTGHLLGLDKDAEAIAFAESLSSENKCFSYAQGSFADLVSILKTRQISGVNGVLLDLGVSSPQLDDATRGFSFMNDGPLDMRMDVSRGMSAADWVASASEAEIADTLKVYGEEKFFRRMARAVVEARKKQAILTTRQLATIVAEANPAWEKGKHPATRAFQAIRIKINNELEDLELGLEAAVDSLLPGGRLVVISFHSLEDRIVKRFMRGKVKGPELPRGIPVQERDLVREYALVGKAVKPNEAEVEQNVRARSAVMRVLEKSSAMTLPGRKRRKLSDELAEPLDSGASFVAAEVPEVPTITKQSWWSLVAENIRVFSLPLLRSIFRVRFIGLGCGLVIVVLSALAVVYSTHWSRQLFSELKGLQLHRDQLEREWSQLLLEQSAWSTHNRIERIAMEQLNMVMPDMDKVEVVR